MMAHSAVPAETQAEAGADARAARNNSPLKFFLLVFALSVPFWLIGAVTDLQLMPGLPISALMAICPLTAAAILEYRAREFVGVADLLKRAFDFRRIRAKIWYAPIVLLMPGVSVIVYVLMRWMDMPLPAPQIPGPAALLIFLAFFVGALGEELGWTGYVIDRLQNRCNAFQASVLLGLVGALWHIVPLLQAHRSPAWIAWWCLYAVAARVLMVWLYNNTGKSVFAVTLFHAMLNLSWMLFPLNGSHFDPRLGGLVMASAAATVTVIWGPKTLARYSKAGSGEVKR